MNSQYKNRLLRFIAEDLLNLKFMKLAAKEGRMNREGNRIAIQAEDEGGTRVVLILSRINVGGDYPIVSVQLRDAKFSNRSSRRTEDFTFRLTETTLEDGELLKHRLVKKLPVELPPELRRNKVC